VTVALPAGGRATPAANGAAGADAASLVEGEEAAEAVVAGDEAARSAGGVGEEDGEGVGAVDAVDAEAAESAASGEGREAETAAGRDLRKRRVPRAISREKTRMREVVIFTKKGGEWGFDGYQVEPSAVLGWRFLFIQKKPLSTKRTPYEIVTQKSKCTQKHPARAEA